MPEEETKGPTLERVLEEENLRAAWLKVKANGGAPGVDGMDVKESGKHLREHWETINTNLRAGAYKPGAVRAVEIPKGSGGVHALGIPNVSDRMIQQAIHQVLSPVWEPDFSDHSHGFRPNRSAHDAVSEAQAYIKAGKKWAVDIDLKSFFDQVDHDKLMGLVALKVRDKTLLRLIGNYLRAPMQEADGSRRKRTRGTPQGGPLSPLLANIYLDPLDKELRDQWQRYIRGWWNYFELADWRREVEDLSGWIRRHMRKCFWLRWKTPRGRLNALRRLGVRGRGLGNAWCCRGAWAMARHYVLYQALKNRTLHRYGLIIPWEFAAAPR